MSSIPKRIFLVDNDPDVQRAVRHSLMLHGYEVVSADTVGAAPRVIREELFHAAIIDLRVHDDGRGADTSGFDIARRLSPSVPFIIYTAYESKDVVDQAYRDMGAHDIVRKHDPDAPGKLIATLDTLFRKRIRTSFNLKITGSLPAERIAAVLRPPDPSLPPTTAEDVEQILCTLFHDATGIEVHPLLPEDLTPSRSVLALVHPAFGRPGVRRVVKFGFADEIAKEVDNYRTMLAFLPGSRLPFHLGSAYARSLGGSCYSLLGAQDTGALARFDAVYRDGKLATVDIVVLLERLFRDTLGIQDAGVPDVEVNLWALHREQFEIASKQVKAKARALFPDALAESKLFFDGVDRALPNPVLPLTQKTMLRAFDVIVKTSLCHGDLNSGNILVDPEGFAWLIDFSHVALSHGLRDIAVLETDIKFNLLQTTELRHLYELETSLFAVQLECVPGADPIASTSDEADIGRAYEVIFALRRIAAQRQSTRHDMREYHLALLANTYKVLCLRHISDAKWKQALLSAAMLCDILEL